MYDKSPSPQPSPSGEGWGEGLLIYAVVFNARLNATSNFTMSCGSSRCGTFTSMLFFLVVNGPESLAKSCSSLEVFREKKIRPTAQRKIAFLFFPGKPTR